MSPIVEWLLEQVAADEAVARAARDDDYWHNEDSGDPNERWGAGWGSVVGRFGEVAECYGDHVTRHITTWDPTRVLAECAAKRKIIALHVDDGIDALPEECQFAFPCPTLLALAQPYADREGFDRTWAVEL